MKVEYLHEWVSCVFDHGFSCSLLRVWVKPRKVLLEIKKIPGEDDLIRARLHVFLGNAPHMDRVFIKSACKEFSYRWRLRTEDTGIPPNLLEVDLGTDKEKASSFLKIVVTEGMGYSMNKKLLVGMEEDKSLKESQQK